MAVRLRNEFYTNNGTQYRVELHDADYGGAVVTSFRDDGFEISWDNESDNFLETIKSSSCTAIFMDDGSGTFADVRNDISVAEEDQFKLVIYKYSGSWNLFWIGVVMTDLVEWQNDNAPREFRITAKDGLNRLEQFKFDEVLASPFLTASQTFMYIIEKCLAKNGLASFHSGDYIKVSIDWNEVSQSLTIPQRVLEYTKIWGDHLKKIHEKTEEAIEDIEAFDCKMVIDSLLKLFCARIIYSEGCYHIQQVSNFLTSTYSEADYNNSGTYVTQNTGVVNQKATGTDFNVLSSGIFGYHPAYRETRLTAKGYLDVLGAYIDAQIVDGTNKTYNKTLQLGTIMGGGSTFATATILAADNDYAQDIDLQAVQIGTGGNSISFTGNGFQSLYELMDTYNAANTNDFTYATLNDRQYSLAIVDNGVTINFSGGVNGTYGQPNRKLEIDFDLFAASQLDDWYSSNLQIKVDVKLICGSYRIKNKSTSPINAGYAQCEWSTTATDKWSYIVKGNDYKTHKVQLVTPEIPFDRETGCTLELTVTLQRSNVAIPFPDPDLFWGMLDNFRVIAWDSDAIQLSDRVIIVENPTQVNNSMIFDFGDILVGDDPITQNQNISRNYLEVENQAGVTYRAEAWDASFDDDYGLVRTMLMEAMALRKTPVEKYMGGFAGDYAAHKSILYDGTTWVLNSVRYTAKMDEWVGSWFAINYSQTSIVIGSERFTPPANGIKPYPKLINPSERIPMPVNPKGKGVIPYQQGIYMDAVETESLDNNHFRSGDALMVYHPDSRELLHEFVVDADTTVTDTSISITADNPDYDIPLGAVLEHNAKEVVESTNVRSDNFVFLGASWSKTVYLTESDFASSIYTLNGTEGITLVNISGGGTYYVDLPLKANSEKNGCGLDLIVKNLAGTVNLRVQAGDSGVYIKTTQGSTSTSLSITSGDSIRVVYDVANQHWQKITI